MTSLSVPVTLRSAEDLTPGILTLLLRAHDPTVTVTDLAVTRTWTGTSSHLYVDAVYADEKTTLPSKLFLKTLLAHGNDPLAPIPELSEGDASVIHDDETRFYSELRPTLDLETMSTFFAGHLAGNQCIIVAEDIGERGARSPDAVQGLTVDQVDDLLGALNSVHAVYWDSPRLIGGADLTWLQDPLTGPWARMMRDDGYTGCVRAAFASSPYKQAHLKPAVKDADTLLAALWTLQEKVARPPITLLHGDCHPRNTYVLPDGRVGLIDWQLVRRGSWSHDVGYSLIGALPPSDRREHERDLLNRYRSRLLAAEVGNVPESDEMWQSYCESPAWGLCQWTVTPDQMYDVTLIEAMVERYAEAFADLGTARLLGGA